MKRAIGLLALIGLGLGGVVAQASSGSSIHLKTPRVIVGHKYVRSYASGQAPPGHSYIGVFLNSDNHPCGATAWANEETNPYSAGTITFPGDYYTFDMSVVGPGQYGDTSDKWGYDGDPGGPALRYCAYLYTEPGKPIRGKTPTEAQLKKPPEAFTSGTITSRK